MCADEKKRQLQENLNRKFLSVQSRSLCETCCGECFSVCIAGCADRSRDCVVLGTRQYSQCGGRIVRCVAFVENGATGAIAFRRWPSNARRRSVRFVLAALPRLSRRIPTFNRYRGRSRDDQRLAGFETNMGYPDRSGSGLREPLIIEGKGYEKGMIR